MRRNSYWKWALNLAAFVGLGIFVWSAVRGQQAKVVMYIAHKSVAETLRLQLANLVSDPALCSCQAGGRSRVLDTSITDGSQKIEFTEIRNSCGPAAPVVLAVNQKFQGKMKVAKIELVNLSPSQAGSLTWNAQWRVTWDTGSGPAINPTEVPQIVKISSPAAGARAWITGCAGPPDRGS